MTVSNAAPPSFTASIATFRDLLRTSVAEQIETTWDQFFAKLEQEPSEYVGQMEHSGWSPVRYDPPKRSKENVREVFAVVLDYDKGGDWAKILATWAPFYGLVYTTKSHGAPNTTGDRLRAVLPLARTVNVEEYTRVWEWAASRSAEAGCPADPQCKDASRFWYDPSSPPGGYKAVRLEGAPINPDTIPIAETPKLRVVPPPTTLTTDDRIRRAKAYLAKIPGAVQGDGGSTQTFNAVAHVMIGFDLSQGDTLALIANDYNPRCDPPWNEKELDHKIESVAKTCKRERGYLLKDRPRVTSPSSAASQAPPIPDEVTVDWFGELGKKKDGTPKRSFFNILTYVRSHPLYRGKWAMDTMTATPWFDDRPVDDVIVHKIRSRADAHISFTPGREDVEAAILIAAQQRPFHPIQQYLKAIVWDGQLRLAAMAYDFLGSDSPLHAQMVRKFMIGAAARAFRPGAKLDTALMLVGAQGIGKSTFFAILGGPWHADSFVDITNKDSFVQIHAAWIYELAELENVVSGARESRLKAWITSTHDMYRAPYSRTAERRARSVVLCGTTNRTQILTDDTGSRRFWIVPIAREIDRVLLAENRDQLWAEAVAAYESGETWWLDEEAEAERERANVEFQDDDSWREPIEDWLSPPSIRETTVSTVLRDALKVDVARQDRWAQMRVAKILAVIGWKRIREASPPRRWKYVRNDVQLELS